MKTEMKTGDFTIVDKPVPAPGPSAGELHAQSGLYTLMARCLEAEVDAALLALLRGPLGETLAELGLDPLRDVAEQPEGEVLAVLAEEFAALFVVPGAVMPYRSVFETGRFFQPQADLASAAYREAGFEFHNLHSGEFSDHVAVMLGFVGRLLTRQAEAAEAGDTVAAEQWYRRRVRFLRDQIGPWVVGWSRRAAGCARHPFYATILQLLEQVVWADICEIADEKTLRRLVSANRRPLIRPKSDPEFRKASGL
jgi:TorA maturation chaperone TorD